jgi:hypothetical protein
MVMLNPELRKQLSQMKLPVADDRHAGAILNRVLRGADSRSRKMKRRLMPAMSARTRSYEDWLTFLSNTLGESLFHQQEVSADEQVREHLFMSIDCHDIAALKKQTPTDTAIPLTLTLIDSLNPENYDALTYGTISEKVLRKVVELHNHAKLGEILTDLAPFLVELGVAYSEEELPARDRFIVLSQDAYVICEMDQTKGQPKVVQWAPFSRWTMEEKSLLLVATRGMDDSVNAVILGSDYFNRVVDAK